jgi:capsular exopolysaccharide synthesis family protein
MARTFEALKRAEKDKQIKIEETKVFEQKPQVKPTVPTRLSVSSQVVEEYHRMKQHIKTVAQDKTIRTILFSSAVHGEGTTTVLVNFGITLANECNTVLLVDANLRNPSLHQIFNVEQRRGLSSLLQGKSSLTDVIKKTNINNLSVITSGSSASNPFNILESESLGSIIKQMKEHAYWVLFDSPPVNQYNETLLLSSKVDGVIMVVQAEDTRWEVAQNARLRIENDKVKLLGVVLNKRKMYIPEWVYNRL